MTNCGTNKESCCTSPVVAAGTFYRTYTNDGSGPTGEADPATVSAFRFDKYDVTVGRFRQFVSAWKGGWLPPAGSGKHAHLNGGRGLVNVGAPADAGLTYETGWVVSDDSNIAPTDTNLGSTWTPSSGAAENLPINGVNWFEAYAFCIWDGGFLPSEAEWEYAAAGGSQEREYPWGSTDPGTANQYAIYGPGNDCYFPTFGPCTGVANIAPVGTATLGAGLWGQLDLAGNVEEWTLDAFSYPYVDPCPDCASLSQDPGFWMVGGGFFRSDASGLLSANRIAGSGRIGGVENAYGFRCARTPR